MNIARANLLRDFAAVLGNYPTRVGAVWERLLSRFPGLPIPVIRDTLTGTELEWTSDNGGLTLELLYIGGFWWLETGEFRDRCGNSAEMTTELLEMVGRFARDGGVL